MKVSKGLYLGVIIGGMVVGGGLFAIGVGTMIAGIIGAQGSNNPQAVANAAAGGGVLFGLLGAVCLLIAGITYVVLAYKAWSAIQDGQAALSPAAGAIPLIIPILHLVWGFVGVWGWAKDYNKYLARHNSTAPRMNEGLFLAQAIATVLCLIPILNWIAGPASLILTLINAAKMCDGINALAGGAPMAAAAGR